MKILMMVTADYAAVEPQTGKLNIIGVFRNIGAREFPVTHRRMYLVIKIGREEADNSDTHKLLVTLTNNDEDVVLAQFESAFQMFYSGTDIRPEHNAIIELNGLVFRKPGNYRFAARVNDGEVSAATFVRVIHSDA